MCGTCSSAVKKGSLPLVSALERWLAPAWRRELLAILVVASVCVAAFFQAQRSPTGSDDCVYFEYAAGTDAGAPHQQQRFALLGAVKLAQAIFGYTSLAYYAVPFVHTFGLILASYFMARALMGIGLAMIAALMVLALPAVLESSSVLLPDIPSLFWLVLGVALFVRALASTESRVPLKRTLGSAVCFFLAVSNRESAAPLLLGLGCFPLALMSKRALKLLLLAAAATVTLALVEVLVVWAVFGDPLYRLHAVTAGQLPQMEKFARTQDGLPEHVTWTYLATRFLESTANDAYTNGWRFLGLGYWYWLCISLPLSLIAAVLAKNRLLLGLFGFLVWSYLAIAFAPSSFEPLIPMLRTKDRYFLVVLVWLPILVVAGWSCFWAWPFQRPAPRHWRLLKPASIFGVGTLYLLVSAGTARHFIATTTQTIRGGHAPLADFYDAVTRFRASGGNVKRVVGPRTLRGASFVWPEPFDIVWRRSEVEDAVRLRAGDFLIAEQTPALQVHPGLLWQQVGRRSSYRYYYLDRLQGARAAGQYGLVVARRSTFQNQPRVSLGVYFKLTGDGVTPTRVHVIPHRGGKVAALETLEWMKEGPYYTVNAITEPFATNGVWAISLEFEVQGRGRFALSQLRFQLFDRTTKEVPAP